MSMIALSSAHSTPLRPLALSGVFAAEILAISLAYDAHLPALIDSGRWFDFLAGAGDFAKMLVAVAVCVALGLLPRLPAHLDAMQVAVANYPCRQYAIAQVLAFVFFAWCTGAIFGDDVDPAYLPDILVLGWLIAAFAAGWLWLLSLAPFAFWRRLLADERRVFAAALAVGALAWLIASYAQSLWTPLSELTFALSAGILGAFYPDVVVDPEHMRLGARGFVVNIAPQCSGYEGMGLVAIFTGFYLTIYRNEFRFPQALLLFPLGILTIWVFNNLRIVALISLGISHSPAVAVGGFHSQAGWISFIVVSVALLLLAYRMPYFSAVAQARGRVAAAPAMTLPMALLIPFVVLLAATMLTSALSADFDWLYPLRVVAVGAAIAWCWRWYGLRLPKFRPEPWAAGAAVFVAWILLVPNDPTRNAEIGGTLAQAGGILAGTWILLRALGAIVTVPVAEELLFRGYLLARLARDEIALDGRIRFSWVALIGSSLLFGLLHADWLAGIVAGLVFGWVRYRGGSIADAIAAHASTNLLLTIYVLATGHWSMW